MAKQNPSVGHSGNGCGPPCKGSFYQERRLNVEKLEVGEHVVILRHPCCNCNTGCRRVTLWHPRPNINAESDSYIIKAIARVRWGDGCGGPEAEIDWKHGVILDLSGCYDEVSFELVEKEIASISDPLLTFGVLSACCGAGAARGCATRTYASIENEGDNAFSFIPIPPFAYAVTFATNDPTGLLTSDVTFYQLGSGIGSFPDGVLASSTGDLLPDPWMLVNGAETIAMTNTAALETNFEPVFLIGV
jgi:hypothetical protein